MYLKDIIKICIYIAVLAAAARISVDLPYTEINITAQTLALLVMASILPLRISVTGIVLYLILGTLGLPVFSEGNSGWEYFKGLSLGYFIGFFLATFFLGVIISRHKESPTILKFIFLHLIATVIVLSTGVLFLSKQLGVQEAISNGMIPFLIGGLVKSLLGGWASYLILYYRKFS